MSSRYTFPVRGLARRFLHGVILVVLYWKINILCPSSQKIQYSVTMTSTAPREREKGGKRSMEIVIRGEPKEIADLVREVQDRRVEDLLKLADPVNISDLKPGLNNGIEIVEC